MQTERCLSGKLNIFIMKQIFFAAMAVFMFAASSCSEREAQIRVRFQNNLSSDIHAARMEFGETHVTELGELPAGQTSEYFTFNYFETGADLPMGLLNGEKDGLAFSAWAGLWCGTGVEFKQLEAGDYTIEIKQFGVDSTGFYQILFVE